MELNRTQLAPKTPTRDLRLADRVGSVRRTFSHELRSKTFRRFGISLFTLVFILAGFLQPIPARAAACATGNDITISVSCEWAVGTHVYTGTLTINGGVTVTAQGSDGSGEGVTVIVDNLVLNGTISADTQGYDAGIVTSGFRNGAGPGGGVTAGFASGGAHGGRGGGNNTNLTYGSAFAPITLGSGGANDGESGAAGAGGGAVKIFLTNSGTITLASGSIISANGGSATTNDHGGGAGGSIWIDATNGTITGPGSGTATIRANGGNAVSGQGGGSGAGGRVALHYTTLSNSANISMSASAGTPGSQSGFFAPGGAGSIFLKDTAATNGNLIFDNANRVGAFVSDQVASSTYLVDNLTIRNGARLNIPGSFTTQLATGGVLTGGGTQPSELLINGVFDAASTTFYINDLDIDHNSDFAGVSNLVLRNLNYDFRTTTATFGSGPGDRVEDLTIDTGTVFTTELTDTLWVENLVMRSGATLVHAGNTTAETNKLSVSATSTIDIQSGATIALDGLGYTVGNGPGAGTSGTNSSGGGGHGGNGGNGGEGVSSAGGGAYGSVTDPNTIGSGGATDESNTQGVGGGAARLVTTSSTGTINISGTVTADGVSTTTTDAGAGAGGSVYISTSTLTGAGTVGVIGGSADNANGGGGGAGGRIALYYDTDSSSIAFSARGGDEGNQSGFVGEDGGAGTIYRKDNQDTYATLIIDNTSGNTSADTPQLTASETYKNITIAGGAVYAVGSGETLTLDTGGTLTGGGSTQATLVTYAGGTYVPPTSSVTFDDLDVINSGTIATVTALTVEDGSFTHGATGNFSAGGGVTSLAFAGTSPVFNQNGGSNLNTTSINVPAGATFHIATEKYYPLIESFGTLTVKGTLALTRFATLFIDALNVQSGGMVRHATNTTSFLYRVDVSATSTVDIDAGASVNVDILGYAAANGPCKGTTVSENSGGGGAHGGNGGGGGNAAATGGTACDSVSEPSQIGSGGESDEEASGGAGGGYVRFRTPTSGGIIVDGTITADGASVVAVTSNDSGGGAGGAVYLSTGTLSGSGTVGALGGSADNDEGGGGGGGGRIAAYYDTDSSSIAFSARGGDEGNQSAFVGDDGGAGTIYLKDNQDTYATLIVDNSTGNTSARTPQLNASETYKAITIAGGAIYEIGSGETFTLASGGTLTGGGSQQAEMEILTGGTFDPGAATFTFNDLDVDHRGTLATVTALTVQSATYFVNTSTATWSAQSHGRLVDLTVGSSGVLETSTKETLYVEDLVVQNTGIARHTNNTTAHTHSLVVSSTNTIELQNGSSVGIDGRGYSSGSGPGVGTGTTNGGGGGYGGNAPTPGSGTGGTAYGSVTQPTDIGSGGGTGGGSGGGAVRFTVGTTLTINGSINAQGTSAGTSHGGGSGGSVYLDADTLAGTGTINVFGGDRSGGSASGGGGGRVAIYYSSGNPNAYTFDAAGGTGRNGGAGTLYLNDDGATTLIVDNDDLTPFTNGYTPQLNASESYDTVIIREGADYQIGSGETLTPTSFSNSGTTLPSLTIETGGTFDPNLATMSTTGVNIVNNGAIADVTTFTFGNGTFTNNGAFTAGLVSLTVGSSANWRQVISSQLFTGSVLTIQNGGTFTQEHTNVIEVDTVTVETGGTLTHCDNTTAKTCQVNFETTNFTVQSGGTVTANGLGFDPTDGPGQGGDAPAGGGAGYGGDGGDGVVSSVSQNNNGVLYGSATGPVDLGSGGGDDTNSGNQEGAPGGGAIRIVASDTLTAGGTITANGTTATSFQGAGGSGGSIWLTAVTFTATANISADGGTGAGTNTTGGGCGAGGRIAIDYEDYSQSATTTAAAGTGCTGVRVAETGSVYLNQTGTPPVPPVNGFTRILPTVIETGDNVVVSASATDDIGVTSIKIYLDGTNPGNLVKTCTFSPAQTPATCEHAIGALAAGAHAVTVVSEDADTEIDTDTTNFTVAGNTGSNRIDLSTYKKSATATASLSFTLSATSTGTLTLTFPSGFTVLSAPTNGSGCLSSFGFTASTMYATKTNCVGAVTMTGGTVTNPAIAGGYTVTWTNDNGSGQVFIVDDDNFNISATVDPVLTFNVGSQTGTCDGSFTGNGGSLSLGSLTTSAVASSDVSSVPHICTRLSTNASGGAVVTVRSQNAALASISSPGHTIPSGTALLTAGTTGYGLCAGSQGSHAGRDSTTPVGASPVRSYPFNDLCDTSGNRVGGLTTAPQIVWSVSDPTQNAFVRLFVKAAIGPGVVTHNDYQDVLTFIATATY